MDQIIEMNIDADYTVEVSDIKLVFVLHLPIIKIVFVSNRIEDRNISILFQYF
jgi:hypothetical protein